MVTTGPSPFLGAHRAEEREHRGLDREAAHALLPVHHVAQVWRLSFAVPRPRGPLSART
jgi:hypothetical protein